MVSGIFFYKIFSFVFSLLNFVFLTVSLSSTLLIFLKSTGIDFNLPTSKSFIFGLKLLKLVGTLASLLKSSFLISVSKQ